MQGASGKAAGVDEIQGENLKGPGQSWCCVLNIHHQGSSYKEIALINVPGKSLSRPWRGDPNSFRHSSI